MRKAKKILEKIIFMIGTFVVSIYTKVLAAVSAENFINQRYIEDYQGQTLYGVKNPASLWMREMRIFIIPITIIITIIGIIMYLKKSTSKISKKRIILLGTIVAITLVFWGIYYLITNIYKM